MKTHSQPRHQTTTVTVSERVWRKIYEDNINEYEERGKEMYWRMRDGTEIKIGEMTTLHVKNCITMLSRRESNAAIESWKLIFLDVLEKRRSEIIKGIIERTKKE